MRHAPESASPSGQRMSFPIGCFLSLIGRKWLLIGCCWSLAFEASATRAPPAVLAHTRTAEEEGTDRGASWNPGGKTVKWPNDPRKQKRQQVFIRLSDQTRLIHVCCFDKDIKTVHGSNRIILDQIVKKSLFLCIIRTCCFSSLACVEFVSVGCSPPKRKVSF